MDEKAGLFDEYSARHCLGVAWKTLRRDVEIMANGGILLRNDLASMVDISA